MLHHRKVSKEISIRTWKIKYCKIKKYPVYNIFMKLCHFYRQCKEECKDQDWHNQVSHLTQDSILETDNTQKTLHTREPRGQPFPGRPLEWSVRKLLERRNIIDKTNIISSLMWIKTHRCLVRTKDPLIIYVPSQNTYKLKRHGVQVQNGTSASKKWLDFNCSLLCISDLSSVWNNNYQY